MCEVGDESYSGVWHAVLGGFFFDKPRDLAICSCGVTCYGLLAYLICRDNGNVGARIPGKVGDYPSTHSIFCEFFNGSCRIVKDESSGPTRFVRVRDLVG